MTAWRRPYDIAVLEVPEANEDFVEVGEQAHDLLFVVMATVGGSALLSHDDEARQDGDESAYNELDRIRAALPY